MTQFVKLPTEVLDRPALSAIAKLVFAVLADRMGDNGVCWPGQRRIARDCGVAPKTVNRAIKELRSAGLITVEQGRLDGPRAERTCRYRLRSVASNVIGKDTFNVAESATLSNGERSRIGNRNVVESTTEPDQENQTKIEPDMPTVSLFDPQAAEAIYSAYPRQIGKYKAIHAIQRALRTIADRASAADPGAWLLERVQSFARSPAGQAGKYTPHPATWFGTRRYDDDEHEWFQSADCASRSDRSGRVWSNRVAAVLGKYADCIDFRGDSNAPLT